MSHSSPYDNVILICYGNDNWLSQAVRIPRNAVSFCCSSGFILYNLGWCSFSMFVFCLQFLIILMQLFNRISESCFSSKIGITF